MEQVLKPDPLYDFFWAYEFASKVHHKTNWELNYFNDGKSCALVDPAKDGFGVTMLANEASDLGPSWNVNELPEAMRSEWLGRTLHEANPNKTEWKDLEKYKYDVEIKTGGGGGGSFRPIVTGSGQTASKGHLPGAGFAGLAELLSKNEREEIMQKSCLEIWKQTPVFYKNFNRK